MGVLMNMNGGSAATVALGGALVLFAGCSYDLDALRQEQGTSSECCEVLQTGCGNGEKCSICASPATRRTQACTAAGSKPPGSACTGDGECVAGTQCWNSDAGDTFICRKFCEDASDCYPQAPRCMKITNHACFFIPGAKANFGLCY